MDLIKGFRIYGEKSYSFIPYSGVTSCTIAVLDTDDSKCVLIICAGAKTDFRFVFSSRYVATKYIDAMISNTSIELCHKGGVCHDER